MTRYKGGVFDPLPENALAMLVQAFETRALSVLPPPSTEVGCGVYALYYLGDFSIYEHLLPSRDRVPVYVGKAVPKGARKGSGDIECEPKQSVVKRLKEHAGTIKQAKNLSIEEFQCRWLSVAPHFVNSAEALLIDHYKPIWNRLISGFGIHQPGGGRLKQARSDWDMLHPGRKFALELPEGNSVSEITARIKAHVKTQRGI